MAGPQEFTDVELLAKHALIPPVVMLKLLRVQLLVRLAQRAPPLVLLLLAVAYPAHGAWLKVVMEDVVWFAKDKELARWAAMSAEEVLDDCATRPKRIRKRLANHARAAARDPTWWSTTRAQAELAGHFRCPDCGHVAATHQGLAVHRVRVHAARRCARYIVPDATCPACLMHFHIRERVISHIHEKNQRCLAYVATLPRLPDDEYQLLEEASLELVRAERRAGRRRGWAALPAICAAGTLVQQMADMKRRKQDVL